MKKLIKIRIFFGLLLSLYSLNSVFSQAGLTNPGTTQEQERNQASYGFDTGKSGSALEQLENMTGQKVNVSNSNSQQYNQRVVTKPALSFDQQMNIMVTGMIAESLISSLFSSNSTVPKVQQAKSQPATLTTNIYGEEKRVQEALLLAKHQKMMDLYKLLDGDKKMKYKSITDISMNIKPYLTQEEIERQKLIKKGINTTWDFNSWAQVSPNNNKMEESSLNYQKTNADKYLDEAINKIETFPGGVGRIAAVAGRFMVNVKDETMSYLNDAKDAAVSGNSSKMDEVGNVDLQKKIVNNSILNTIKQTGSSYIEQGKDLVKGYVGDKADEVNFAIMKNGAMKYLDDKKIYGRVSDSWKVPLKPYSNLNLNH